MSDASMSSHPQIPQVNVEWVDPVAYRELAAAVVPTIERDDHRAIAEDLLRQLDLLLATRTSEGTQID